jgi:hypothetical protein
MNSGEVMTKIISVAATIVTAGLAVTLSGCGGASGRPVTFPVSGKVTLNGEPVEGAQVSFFTEGSSRAAAGTTDADGAYRLTTFDTNDGAIAGDHSVTISKVASAGTSDGMDIDGMGTDGEDDPGAAYGEAMDNAGAGTYGTDIESLIPAKYASTEESGLTRTVTASETENVFNFDL